MDDEFDGSDPVSGAHRPEGRMVTLSVGVREIGAVTPNNGNAEEMQTHDDASNFCGRRQCIFI